jgi:hypothetical protein
MFSKLRLLLSNSRGTELVKDTKPMKLGVSYNLFDGEELLESSISCVREHVDYVSVVYQTVSNYGQACTADLVDTLIGLKRNGLVDELYEYTPQTFSRDKNNASYNELEKRNVGLNMSRRNGCTHHMSMDCDEFYVPEQFEYMKKVIAEHGYESAACQYQNYYKDSIYLMSGSYDEAYVSTIYKINPDTAFIYRSNNSPVRIDSTRKTNNKRYKVFEPSKVLMHHMSMVRKDLRKKLMSSTFRKHGFKDINATIHYYDNWEYPEPAMSVKGSLVDIIKVGRLFDEFPFIRGKDRKNRDVGS